MPQRLKFLLFSLVAFVTISLCDFGHSRPDLDLPLRNFPQEYRQENWGQTGSCGFAATAGVLNINGWPAEAEIVRECFIGGAWWPEVKESFDYVGVPCVLTNTGDTRFLETVCRDGRCCVVGLKIGGATVPYAPRDQRCGHALILFYFDSQRAGLYDNNHQTYYGGRWHSAERWVTREEFLHDWQRWAVTVSGE